MLIETCSLTKRYGSFSALDDCSMQVETGEVFGLLGPNGAGKTTLIRLLMGFLRPTGGSATIDGLDCYRQSVEVNARAAYLPGDARLFRGMRGTSVLKFFARARRDGDYRKSIELAERLELDVKCRVGMMSTGMRQKLALAATLSANTPLLILDEPTANLDPNVRSEISLLLNEARDDGRTVLLSSHVLSEIEETCDRVVILRQGRLVHTQIMSDLRQRHQIVAKRTAQLPAAPAQLKTMIEKIEERNGHVAITTVGDLSKSLPWITTLPLREMKIEPLGLRSVYDRFHAPSEWDKE